MSDHPDAPASLHPGKNTGTHSAEAGGGGRAGVSLEILKDKYLSPTGIQTPDRPQRNLLIILITREIKD